jgi:hypothetical protein
MDREQNTVRDSSFIVACECCLATVRALLRTYEVDAWQLVFFIIPVSLKSVQVHSVNWSKEVDKCLGERRSLALFYN